MKKTVLALTFIVVTMLSAPALAFELKSPTLIPGGTLPIEQLFNGFGCNGPNISPPLSWTDPPKGTKSFALNVYDPDAPTGSGWWHWVVMDIPAKVRSLEQGASAKGLPAPMIQSLTDFGMPSFGGACPPKGDKPHRYIFTLYALDVPTLGLDAKAMPALAGFMINQHVLGKASITVTYGQ